MKPKREITLGEMQDECKTRIKCCTGCPYKEVCGEIPKLLDLTDPPRFTEAQMALLRALYDVGVLELVEDCEYEQVIIYTCNGRIGGFKNDGGIKLPLRLGETLDLAELFGKEGEK